VHTIALRGEFDLANVSAVAEQIDRAIADGSTHLLVDLSGVTFMGSSLLNTLRSGREACHRRGGSLHVVGESSRARRLMVLTGLNSLIQPSASSGSAS
jgi:anti-sigma B factor antagonist